MVKRWNAAVGEGDVVYHLGDVSFGSKSNQRETLRKLRGRKILIQGNHDYDPDFLKECGFESVQYDMVLELPGLPLYLRHIPAAPECIPRHCRFALCGHLHRAPAEFPWLNVGVDRFQFRPIAEEEVLHALASM